MGDGVNIAARLEGIAKPGSICLSEDAYRQVKQRLDLKVSDLGATQLKNIAEPIHAYLLEVGVAGATGPVPQRRTTRSAAKPRMSRRWPAVAAALALVLIAAGAFAWRAGYVPRFMAASIDDHLANAPHLSIVVLPFENLSGDKEQDYFADGITDDLTTDLSHLEGSFVISRGTAFTYKGKPIDAKQSGANSACAICSKAACGVSARRSRSTRSSSRRRPALTSGPIGSKASATSSASCRSRPYPGLPIRSGFSS